jgi:RIO kinase 1
MSEVIDKLHEVAPRTGEDDTEAAAALEVDNEVFRNQYIPQTLEQVYDVEKDGEKLEMGEGNSLVYKNLLADQVVDPKKEDARGSETSESDSESDGEGASLGSDESGDDKFDKGRPRGRRFEDKDEKKVRYPITEAYGAILTGSRHTRQRSRRQSGRSARTRCPRM